MTTPKKDVWIGLVGVKPKLGSKFLDKNAKGAYANVLAWVAGTSEYRTRVRQFMRKKGLEVDEIEDLERFSARMQKYRLRKTLVRLAERVKEHRDIRFDTFYIYLSEKGKNGMK